jgi:hypothetical protein
MLLRGEGGAQRGEGVETAAVLFVLSTQSWMVNVPSRTM